MGLYNTGCSLTTDCPGGSDCRSGIGKDVNLAGILAGPRPPLRPRPSPAFPLIPGTGSFIWTKSCVVPIFHGHCVLDASADLSCMPSPTTLQASRGKHQCDGAGKDAVGPGTLH